MPPSSSSLTLPQVLCLTGFQAAFLRVPPHSSSVEGTENSDSSHINNNNEIDFTKNSSFPASLSPLFNLLQSLGFDALEGGEFLPTPQESMDVVAATATAAAASGDSSSNKCVEEVRRVLQSRCEEASRMVRTTQCHGQSDTAVCAWQYLFQLNAALHLVERLSSTASSELKPADNPWAKATSLDRILRDTNKQWCSILSQASTNDEAERERGAVGSSLHHGSTKTRHSDSLLCGAHGLRMTTTEALGKWRMRMRRGSLRDELHHEDEEASGGIHHTKEEEEEEEEEEESLFHQALLCFSWGDMKFSSSGSAAVVTKEKRGRDGLPLSSSSSTTEHTAKKMSVNGKALEKEEDANVAHSVEWLEAQIFGAICFLGGFSALTPLAKLLVYYIHQGETAQGRHARISGVVAGILQAALEVVRSSVWRAILALDQQQQEFSTNTSNNSKGTSGVTKSTASSCGGGEAQQLLLYPLPDEANAVAMSAGFLLAKLMEWSAEYDANSTALVEEVGQVVCEHLNALLLSVITGCGTAHVSEDADAPPTTNTKAKPASTSTPTVTRRLVVMRGLSMAEADALLSQLFPSFLQSVGYEWPWSETMRHWRSVEKSAAAAGASVGAARRQRVLLQQQQSGGVGGRVTMRSSGVVLPPVQWSSKLVVDAILIACAKRTYPTRLRELLPGTFHPLLDALGVAPVTGLMEIAAAEPDEEERLTPKPLFTLPAYYDEVGTAVMAYWDQVGTLSAIRLEELQRLLHLQTSMLPMIVQIRAMGPSSTGNNNSSSGGAEQAGDDLLSSATVEALVARYEAEVLLASVVVYTQLSVPSQCQGLLRVVAPLLEKYLLTYSRQLGEVGNASFPLFTTVSPSEVEPTEFTSQLPSGFVWRFSSAVRRVCGGAGYQLYPMEWLTYVADMYTQYLKWQNDSTASSAAGSDDVLRPLHPNGNPYPYSLFAAVGHQLGLQLRTGYGNSGDAKQRVPNGYLSSNTTLVPPFSTTDSRSAGDATVLSPSSTGMSFFAADESVSRRRAERFAQWMEWVFLDMRTDAAHSQPVVLTNRYTEQQAGDGCGRGGSFGTTVWREDSTVEDAYFHTFLEVKDFWIVACQGGFPSSVTFNEEYQKMKLKQSMRGGIKAALASSSSSSLSWGQTLLLAALRWCKLWIGSYPEAAKLASWREQIITQDSPSLRSSYSSPNSITALLVRFGYNSAALDGCPIARQLLRSAPLRLLEKTRRLAQVREALVESSMESKDGEVSTRNRDRVRRSVDTACFLLNSQYRQWVELSNAIGLDSRHAPLHGGNLEAMKSDSRFWLWCSPYFEQELLFLS